MTIFLVGHLTWLANYSNFYSVMTVVVCFILMVVFILRLNGENIFMHPRAVHYFNNAAEEKVVTNIRNPFFVKIKPQNSNCLADGVTLEFSLLKSSKVYTLWGISLSEFHQRLVDPWQEIVQKLQNSDWLSDHIMSENYYGILDTGSSSVVHISTPDCVTEESLGQSPRNKYPLVVVTVDIGQEVESQSVVAMFTVIHLKDNICKLDTQIVSQYLKTRDNQIRHLQPLFVTTSSESTRSSGTSDKSPGPYRSETEAAQNENETATQNSSHTGSRRSSADRSDTSDRFDDCIVCQSLPISYALLPCRHACVCHVCLKKIGDKCPMCRGLIEMYFSVNHDSRRNSTGSSSGSGSDSSELLSETRWERMNRRLNEFLGFL